MSLIEIQDKPADLVGRLLALNTTQCRRFQCGGFHLGPNCLYAAVPPGTQQAPLHRALLDGRLLDITDQNLKEFHLGDSMQTPACEIPDDPGRKVYLSMDSKGGLMVIAPRDEEDEKRIEGQIAKNGIIVPEGGFTVSDQMMEGAKYRVDHDQASILLNKMSNALDKART